MKRVVPEIKRSINLKKKLILQQKIMSLPYLIDLTNIQREINSTAILIMKIALDIRKLEF
jgi:hypothetical protein